MPEINGLSQPETGGSAGQNLAITEDWAAFPQAVFQLQKREACNAVSAQRVCKRQSAVAGVCFRLWSCR
jgi:hypothetical protein